MSNRKFLSEQPDSHAPFQIEKFGYKSNDPKTWSKANELRDSGLRGVANYVNYNMESDLRDFLYSPEGIASIAAIDFMGGEPISMTLFAILVAYDVKKWIDRGEPNWLFLITDLICVGTAGFAGSVATPLINAAKKLKFQNLTTFFSYIFKNFRPIWTRYIVPFSKSVQSYIGKIISVLSKIKSSLTSKLSSSISTIINYLSKLGGLISKSIELVIGKAGVKTAKTYAKYKIASKTLSKAEETDIGKKIIKGSLPYINPLLGSDKIDPFLLDLITSPNTIDLLKYKLNPIFADNSKDTF